VIGNPKFLNELKAQLFPKALVVEIDTNGLRQSLEYRGTDASGTAGLHGFLDLGSSTLAGYALLHEAVASRVRKILQQNTEDPSPSPSDETTKCTNLPGEMASLMQSFYPDVVEIHDALEVLTKAASSSSKKESESATSWRDLLTTHDKVMHLLVQTIASLIFSQHYTTQHNTHSTQHSTTQHNSNNIPYPNPNLNIPLTEHTGREENM
jgi:hypothetical protein